MDKLGSFLSFGGSPRRQSNDERNEFLDVLRLHSDLWEKAFNGVNVLCCPLSASLSREISREDLMTHIIRPLENPGEYESLNGHRFEIVGQEFQAISDMLDFKNVRIISSGQIMNAKGLSANIYRIGRPFIGGLSVPEDGDDIDITTARKFVLILKSFPETEEIFMVVDDFIKEIGYLGKNSTKAFSKIKPSMSACIFKYWQEATYRLSNLKSVMESVGCDDQMTSKSYVGQIVESYIMSHVAFCIRPYYKQFYETKHTQLLENIVCMKYYSQHDFKIRPEFQMNYNSVLKEFMAIEHASTPADMLIILKNVVNLIRTKIDTHILQQNSQFSSNIEFATDDLVVILAYLMCEMYNTQGYKSLFSDIFYIKSFHFVSSSLSHLGYNLCHYEVAVSYLETIAKEKNVIDDVFLHNSPYLSSDKEGTGTGTGIGTGTGTGTGTDATTVSPVSTSLSNINSCTDRVISDTDRLNNISNNSIIKTHFRRNQRWSARIRQRCQYGKRGQALDMLGDKIDTPCDDDFKSEKNRNTLSSTKLSHAMTYGNIEVITFFKNSLIHPSTLHSNGNNSRLNIGLLPSHLSALLDERLPASSLGSNSTGNNTSENMPTGGSGSDGSVVYNYVCAGGQWSGGDGGYFLAVSDLVSSKSKGRIYSWGWPGYGRLGHGGASEVDSMLPIPAPRVIGGILENVVIKMVACGKDHSLAISENGALYAWGDNRFGQLGIGLSSSAGKISPGMPANDGASMDEIYPPTRVNSLNGFCAISIACGDFHSLCLVVDTTSSNTNSGSSTATSEKPSRNVLYSWGRGSHGRLGQYAEPSSAHSKFVKITKPTPVRPVWMQEYRSTSLPTQPSDASISSLTTNAFIHNDTDYRTLIDQVVHISAAHMHSLAITESGKVFSWGCGIYGRLGHGSHCDEFLPKQIYALSGQHITSCSAGPLHSMFLSHRGLLFGCGLNSIGEVGCVDENYEIEDESRGRPVSVQSVSGEMSSDEAFERLCVLCPRPVVIQCHECDDVATAHTPVTVAANSSEINPLCIAAAEDDFVVDVITSVSCGNRMTVCVTNENKVFCWGNFKYSVSADIVRSASSAILRGQGQDSSSGNEASGRAEVKEVSNGVKSTGNMCTYDEDVSLLPPQLQLVNEQSNVSNQVNQNHLKKDITDLFTNEQLQHVLCGSNCFIGVLSSRQI